MATAGTISTVGELLGDNPCVQCLNPKEKLQALIYLLAVANSMTLPDDLSELNTSSACEQCSSDTRLLDAIISVLWTAYGSQATASEIKTATSCLNCTSDSRLKDMITYLIIKYVEGVANPD